MQTVVCNLSTSLIDRRGESVALRAAIFVSDRTVSAGDSHYELFLEEHYKRVKGVKAKMAMMNSYYEKSEGEAVFDLRQLTEAMRASSLVKHKSSKQIIMEKQMEKSVDRMFEIFIQEIKNHINSSGLSYLGPMVNNETFDFCVISNQDSEAESKQETPASTILQRQSSKYLEAPFIFCLTPEYFQEKFIPNHPYYTSDEASAVNVKYAYLEKCFALPNINALITSEIITVHNELDDVAIPFRKAVDEWVTMCNNDRPPAETLEHFRKQVMPEVKVLSDEMDKNDLLVRLHEKFSKKSLEVYLGEVPLWTIWDFYETHQAFTKTTWEKMREVREKHPELNRRYPVMVLRTPTTPEEREAAALRSQTQKTKKSIEID